MENKGYKYGISLRKGEFLLWHHTDDKNDLKLAKDFFEGIFTKEVPIVQKNKEFMEKVDDFFPPEGCDHANVRPFEGVSKFGPWRAEECLDCHMVRFESKSKSTGQKYWKPWQPPKERQPWK